MKDDVIQQALVNAIVAAFFVPQTVYEQNGAYRTYGGQLGTLVEAIIKSPEFKEIEKEVLQRISKDQIADDTVRAKIQEMVVKRMESNTYVLNDAVNASVNTLTKKVADEETAKMEDAIRAKVAENLDGEYDIKITVSAVATKKV